MTSIAIGSPQPRGIRPRPLLVAGLLTGTATVGAASAIALRSLTLSAPLLLAGALALLGLLALAVARYDAAVTLGFLVFPIVRVEPSPSDIVFAIVILVAVLTGRFRLGATPLGIVAPLVLFVMLNLAAAMEAVDPSRAARFGGITIYLLLFALWVPSWLRDGGRARKLVRIYITTATASAVVGSVALLFPVPGRNVLTDYEITRARALFKDPNVFGPFLVPAALIVMYELLQPRLLRSGRTLKLVTLALLAVGILLAYSRAAWLNFAVGAVVLGAMLVLRRNGARQTFIFLGVVGLAVAMIATAAVASGQVGFLQERAHRQTYDTQRFAAQTAGLELGATHPLGIGPGQFERYEPISAHSTYVRAFAEEGPLGFLMIVSIMIGTLVLALRNAARSWDTYGISSAVLLACWCGILANSLFLDTLHWRHLWLIAGLIWGGSAGQTSS